MVFKRMPLGLCVYLLFIQIASGQNDYINAPNSYIFDIEYAVQNDKGGILIPVAKAYDIWKNGSHFNQPIPNGTLSTSMQWEDTSGLIRSVEIISGDSDRDSDIKVLIDTSKGKGNAVIAFHVGNNGNSSDPIYWSWHIWVTDDPSNGYSFGHAGLEKNINFEDFTPEYMDRNLGAASNTFLGHQWYKSGGLMYQWGRKDPFPTFIYNDHSFYEVSGEVGNIKHTHSFAPNNSTNLPMEERPFSNINDNIRFSVQNPFSYIYYHDNNTWFSESRRPTSDNTINFDLWSDNSEGGLGGQWGDNISTYKLKSVYDPCPNGWRIPSYLAQQSNVNAFSPWGRNGGTYDDGSHARIFSNQEHQTLDEIKVYPALGTDFTSIDGRKMGRYSLSGKYHFYSGSNRAVFQDEFSESAIWSATLDGSVEGRIFKIISDVDRILENEPEYGLHSLYSHTSSQTHGALAVRCMKDPNIMFIGDFPTQYTDSEQIDYREGLFNPNSYIAINQTEIIIPVNKAFSVHNQYLSDHEMRPSDNLIPNILWTTNTSLIEKVYIEFDYSDAKKSNIVVELNPAEHGNAVVSLHNGNITNPAYWSWHIWAPESDPTIDSIVYNTESTLQSLNLINPTHSGFPSLQTIFMDRNLGAVTAFPEGLKNNPSDPVLMEKAKESGGLLYQWGRKDPLPSFIKPGLESYEIFMGQYIDFNGHITYTAPINDPEYLTDFTTNFETYETIAGVSDSDKKHIKIAKILKYASENPLTFMFQTGTGQPFQPGITDFSQIRDWLSQENGYASERWGHADRKSPFDPCPEGWRVPDVSFAFLTQRGKGSSPWFNGDKLDIAGQYGIGQDVQNLVSNYYGGTQVINNQNTLGWVFSDEDYNIGNFPATGTRGLLGNNTIQNPSNSTGVWTAAMADLATGYALAMDIESGLIRTGAGHYPQAGMNVRCAKDIPRFASLLDDDDSELGNDDVNPLQNSVFTVYPNPTKDILYVNSNERLPYIIYNINGALILKGEFREGATNISSIGKGIYLIVIDNKEVKKIIKN